MISDKQLAADISQRILRVNELLNEMANLVAAKGMESEVRPFCLAIGQVSGELLLSVANPLYRAHPELKPEGMD